MKYFEGEPYARRIEPPEVGGLGSPPMIRTEPMPVEFDRDSLIRGNQESMAQIRRAHLPNVTTSVTQSEPETLELSDILDILENGRTINTSVIKTLVLEMMTLRDEVATLEEKVQSMEFYEAA